MDDSLFGASQFLPPRDGGNGADEPRSSSRDGTSFRRMMLFAGRSSIDLAERIADDLGVALGESTLKTFPNTETYVRFNESVRGSDVFLIQSCSRPCNDNAGLYWSDVHSSADGLRTFSNPGGMMPITV